MTINYSLSTEYLNPLSCYKYILHRVCQSLVDDWKKVNAKFSGQCAFGSQNPTSSDVIQSFITRDNKHIVVFNNVIGYNVYDMINDEWLFTDDFTNYVPTGGSCCKISFETFKDGVRSLFLNDEMIIVSEANCLSFYYIPTKDFKSLSLIYQHRLKTQNLDYCYHGMCCIELKHIIVAFFFCRFLCLFLWPLDLCIYLCIFSSPL